MAEAKKKVEATKPTPEEKQAAAEAEVDALVARAKKALVEFENLDQKQVDRIVAKASIAALNKHLVLAKMAVDETGRGLVEDKATKNIFACEHVTNYLAGQKTVGIIREDDVMGIDEIAEPVGVVAGVTPVTNPTSTAIFKSLIALKTRCPIIFGFHPGAQKCSVEAAKIVRDAAIEAGAPENCIQWIEHPSIEATGALMKHDGIATILATGGPGMVKAAYSSGKPALGVGAGNAPAYVDTDVDIVRAANDLVLSKHFDYGMICATEQAIIADKGPQALAMVQDPRPSGKYYTKRFMNALGSPNVYTHGAACNLSKESGFTQAIGAANFESDVANSKMTMFIGRSYADAARWPRCSRRTRTARTSCWWIRA